MNIKSIVLANPHTTSAAGVFFLVKVLAELAVVWSPTHKEQIKTTADILEGAAIFYMGAAAGDASKSASKEEVADAIETGKTDMLRKGDAPKSPGI